MPRSAMLHGITKDMRGIEIAPWYNPLTPKRDGFNCLVLDVFSKEELLKRAAVDHNIIDENTSHIEHVDIVGSATEIENLVPDSEHGKFDYIVSCHNFEHLPNPIKFLRGCQKLLRPGGVLCMALPDKRACFDLFRPHSTVVDWLVAFREDRSRPSAEQLFEWSAYFSILKQYQNNVGDFSIHTPLDDITVVGDLGAQYRKWQASGETSLYEDAHCSVMTPASFELLILECRHLGLLSIELESVSQPEGCEFFVRLVNAGAPCAALNINAARTNLMRRMLEEGQILRKKKWTWRKRLSVNYIRAILRKVVRGINGGASQVAERAS